MKSGTFFLILLLLGVSLPASAHAQTLSPKSKPENKTGVKTNSQGAMTQEELQFAVMAFADNFGAKVTEASIKLENQATTPNARLAASRMKVFSVASAVGIASGPYPGPALLDLVVLTTLNRMVWEKYWRPRVFGPAADEMVTVLRKLEADIWSLAGKLLTKQQQGDLRDLILQWFDDNPGKKSVHFIRFSDFGPRLGRKPHLKEITKPGGLLAPVTQAAQEAEKIRMTAERAVYLFSRVMLIAGFQAELVYQELVNKPEVQELLTQTAGFKEIFDNYGHLISQLPVQMAKVGTRTVDQAVKRLSVEREAIINQITQNLSAEREAAIAQAVRAVSQERDTMVKQLSRAIAAERSAALTQAVQGISQERKEIMKELSGLMNQSENFAEDWMTQAFFLGTALILVILLAMLLYRYATDGHLGFRGMAATAAVLLAVLATMAYWKYGLQKQSRIQYIEISDRTGQDLGNFSKTNRSADHSGENRVYLIPSGEGERGGRFVSDDVTAEVPDRSKEYRKNESEGKVETERSSIPDAEYKFLHTKRGPPKGKSSHQDSANQGPKTLSETGKSNVKINISSESKTTLSAYSIQLESWRKSKTAQKRIRYFKSVGLEAWEFKSVGLEAWEDRVELPGKGIYYRVYVGRFPSISKAKDFQARLEKEYDLNKGVVMPVQAVKN